jgi:hypothetical protein
VAQRIAALTISHVNMIYIQEKGKTKEKHEEKKE